MSLRAGPIEQPVDLPDGRSGVVRVGLLDPYIRPAEQSTVGLELRVDGEVLAALNTVLDAADDSGARALAREAADGLRSGAIQPTAEALERLADEPR